jgi:hypothetical protein
VKYYENLRLVYEIQTRLSEWTQQDETAPEPTGPEAPPAKGSPSAAPGAAAGGASGAQGSK